ncbi:hypothetical protein CAPTEDRAFT_214137 [Capitella teleta]|uniref:Uncharacterized protein n=1 Tax=Capitella teleta TaxID=283909 RepID=R7TRN6_CAPTE|nr:hypothetical protein CAPTEDRAFT_214137 [Capitella teleta]|eukprot:ELT94161.1 hypothetical protein CAPTEDRAFT_214137 [Capitella teleta]
MTNRTQIATFVDWSPGLSINKYDGERTGKNETERQPDPEKGLAPDSSKRKSYKHEKSPANNRHKIFEGGKTFRTVIDGKRYPQNKTAQDNNQADDTLNLNLAPKPNLSFRTLPSLVSYPQPDISNSGPMKSDSLEKLCVTPNQYQREPVKTASSLKNGYNHSAYRRKLPAIELPSGGACVRRVENCEDKRMSKTFVEVFLPPLE